MAYLLQASMTTAKSLYESGFAGVRACQRPGGAAMKRNSAVCSAVAEAGKYPAIVVGGYPRLWSYNGSL